MGLVQTAQFYYGEHKFMSLEIQYIKSNGDQATGEITLAQVAQCKATGTTLSARLNSEFSDHDPERGTVVEQAMNSLGVYLEDDPSIGVRASSMASALGESQMASGTAAGAPIVSATPSTENDADGTIRRLLFGETILGLVEDSLQGNNEERTEAAFRRMIATSYSIPGGVFVQPKINSSAALDDEYESSPVENTLPPQMVGISLSANTQSIPAYTIGLEITDKARQQVTLPMVAMIIAQHSRILRNRGIWRDISRIFTGNPTVPSEGALTGVTATSLDASIGGATNTLTEKAWFTFLNDPDDPYTRDVAVMDSAAYLAIVNRSGRTEIPAGGYAVHGMTVDSNPTLLNWINVGVPDVIVVPTGVLPAGTILTFDSSKAIAEVSDATAQYQAEESNAMRRNTAFRWDWSRLLYRMMGDAPFKVLTLV